MRPASFIVGIALGAGIMGAGTYLVAGPLNPPGGPVASSYKTLSEVEPRIAINAANTPGDASALYRITQPGSYYFTGNITGVAGKSGIGISASSVTIDLCGFELQGVAGSIDGVQGSVGNSTNLVVSNGSVRGWGGTGVDFGIGIYGGRLERLHAEGNTADGLVGGNAFSIKSCSAYNNGASGIRAFSGAVIEGCSARDNGGHGFLVTIAASLSGCAAYLNGGNGFNTSSSSTVVSCTAVSNTEDGILGTSSCTIRANTCSANGAGDGAGIHVVGGDNRIEGNNCVGADRGIEALIPGNIIFGNTCSGNTINWVIGVGNSIGPIVVAGTNAVAISTSGAVAGTLGSTDSRANFSY